MYLAILAGRMSSSGLACAARASRLDAGDCCENVAYDRLEPAVEGAGLDAASASRFSRSALAFRRLISISRTCSGVIGDFAAPPALVAAAGGVEGRSAMFLVVGEDDPRAERCEEEWKSTRSGEVTVMNSRRRSQQRLRLATAEEECARRNHDHSPARPQRQPRPTKALFNFDQTSTDKRAHSLRSLLSHKCYVTF